MFLGSRFLLSRPARHLVKYLRSGARWLPSLPRSALGRSLQTLRWALQRVLLPTPPERVRGWPGGRGGVDPRAQHPTAGVHGSEPAAPRPPLPREGCGLGRLARLEMRFGRARAAVLTAKFRFLNYQLQIAPAQGLTSLSAPQSDFPDLRESDSSGRARPAPPPAMRAELTLPLQVSFQSHNQP